MAIRTPLTGKKSLYADFHMDLFQNPVSLDLARNTDEEAVKQSIRNLLLTDRGERPFQPLLGSDLRQLLFENFTPDTVVIAKQMVRETIENYEPRANLIGVDILANPDVNTISVVVVFNVINSEEDITLVTTLARVR
jgi:phage baseplate assembly protein W